LNFLHNVHKGLLMITNTSAVRRALFVRVTLPITLACLATFAPLASAVPVSLSSLSGGVTFTIPELAAAPAPELLTLSITGGVFPAGFTGEVDLLEVSSTGVQTLSDRILFDNGGPNVPAPIATINFLSDDEQGNLPPGFLPPYSLLIPPALETAPAVVTIPIIDLSSGTVLPLTAVMISDLDPPGTNLPPNLSDAISLRTPEPSAMYLAAVGLISLAGIAYRRRFARIR
jgi:hypothetical protein